MPPAKRKAEEATAAPGRVTRSTTKRSAASSGSQPVAELPEEKKKTKKAKGKQVKWKEEEEEEGAPAESDKVDGDSSENVLDASNKTIVVEHCKQCNSFKTRANLVKEGLEKSTGGITVIVNPEKPRRGCFEIRQQGGKKFISLLDMKRPFKPMKNLDMDKVISDIIDEISSTS
ncbi:uncharacterized protein LOC133307798 [Gastrolobium bilobum]|uniref:uncharacterized protein LOC133307798 n=1 Tax=Gastrolobium bilobum TaxID=150636 RepID=UPI002AB12560|nr:uncharacterized protein LOC133307798 [Gastrolobium bilobum]